MIRLTKGEHHEEVTPFDHKGDIPMKKFILVAAATLSVVLSAAPTFAGDAAYRGVKENIHHNRAFRSAPITGNGAWPYGALDIALPG